MIREKQLRIGNLNARLKRFIKSIAVLLLLTPLSVFAWNKAPIDITKTSLSELEYYLNEGIVTSSDLVKLYLDRIEYYKDYNAIITTNEKALQEAEVLDKERSLGKTRSALHGIPIIVKDNIDVLNMPTTAGAKALKDNYPKADAEVIKKLKDAGVIILAKTNMSEFAFLSSSSRSTYGTVKNAYNKNYSSYGSSGGSAVGVALNLAPLALGTDTNSSVRVPASASSLVGYRPTTGNLSNKGILPYDPERDTIGLLTKTVSDSLEVLNLIIDNKYKISMPNLKGITIGVPENFYKGSDNNKLPENKETYEEIQKLMTNAIQKLESNGAKIVYLKDYYTTDSDYLVSNSYSGYLFCDSFNKYIQNTTGSIRSFESLSKSSNKINDISNYAANCNTTRTLDEKNKNKQKYSNYIEKIYTDNNLDVIIYPTTKNKLLKDGTAGIINTSAHAASTINYPAISMPLGFDKDNLPYGLEFMVPKNQDEKLFNIVNIYEKINPINKPEIAPNLYKIDESVIDLLNNYQSPQKVILKYNWKNKAKEFFKTYNENKNVEKEAKKLNQEYKKRILFLRLIKIVLLLLIFLYIRSKFKK